MIAMPTESEPVTIIEGDCLEVLRELPDGCVDAVVTDPPYGMNWDVDISRFSGGSIESQKKRGHMGPNQGKRSPRLSVAGDDQPFDPAPWLDFPRVVLWGYHHFAQRLPVGTVLGWVKRNETAYGSFLSDAELAWMKGGHGVYLRKDLSMNAETWDRQHPCQKPVSLLRWCIERANVPPGGVILDPFAGSGTTGVAAILEGRRCILIEKEPAYVEICKRRVAEAMGRAPNQLPFDQPELFAGVA